MAERFPHFHSLPRKKDDKLYTSSTFSGKIFETVQHYISHEGRIPLLSLFLHIVSGVCQLVEVLMAVLGSGLRSTW